MFLVMQFLAPWIFAQFLNHSPEVLKKSLEYLHFRSFGIFFSYAGLALIALYTGVARTNFVLVDTIILAVVNLLLNYCLIFGKFGFPEMGIAGSGLASTIAEILAFFVFVIYAFWDCEISEKLRKKTNSNHFLWKKSIFRFEFPDFKLIKKLLEISLPVAAQAALGQGSWVVFFAMIENLGERSLAVSNLARTVFLCLSIPAWGYASGVNTLISNLLGQNRPEMVIRAALKTGRLCWVTTMFFALPVVFFPQTLLYPVFGKADLDMSLMVEAQPIFYVLLVVLTLFSFGGVLVNAVSGTGATAAGLKMQILVIGIYLGYVYYITHFTKLPLAAAWFGEAIYWLVMLIVVGFYLWKGNWRVVKI
jgi:Na+-driven multidrug efflux pump